MTISDRFSDYAKDIAAKFEKEGIRVEVDYRAEKIGYKIREAQLDKVPYMVIIGQKEVDEAKISVRSRDEGDMGSMSAGQFIEKLKEEI